jgi:hypothetical protein
LDNTVDYRSLIHGPQHVKAQLASNPWFQKAMDDITEFHTKTGISSHYPFASA